MGHLKSTSPITPKHNLPHHNPFFTGRVDVLNQLDELIKSNQQVAIKQAISGMGGVGKTQTALEFCHQHINDYQTILWINAENQISFNNSYYSLVGLLNLVSGSGATNDGASNDRANQALKVDEVISLVKRWLANNPNWLMVLDNLEDPKLIKEYLPSEPKGHILITTRSQSLKGQAAIVQLKKMSPETGTLFLLKRASLIPIDTSNLEQLKADNNFDNNLDAKLIDVLIDDAQKIVQAMDGLPLALEQAGAYIQESACSLAAYLGFYQQALTDNQANDLGDHPSVFATFSLAFDKVKRESVTAANLLEVCSFLDSDLIPEEIFTSAGKFLGDELGKLQDNNYEFNNCLKLLLNYSLIERDTNNKSLSIHRLVQTVIRELISEDNKKSLIDSLAKALNSLCSNDAEDPKNWPTYQKLLPSITSLVDFAKLYQSNTVETAGLFHQFGLYCDKQALFAQSLTFYNLVADIYKHHFGDLHPSIAQTLNNIANTYNQQGNYPLALDFYTQSLAINKPHFGDYPPDVASTLNNVANTYAQQGNYSNALDLYNQSLKIYEYCFGNNHSDAANCFLGIANIYRQQGKHSDALDFYNQSLAIKKLHFDDNHPDVASILNNIGATYFDQADYTHALSCYNQSLSIYKHHFGDYHPDVAMTLNNIGSVYHQQGKYSDALDFYNQSLAIKKLHFGDFHPSVAVTLANLGHLHKAINKEVEAANYYKQALYIYDQVFPATHPWIAELLATYSQLLLKLNKPDEAQPLLDRLASLESSP